MSAMKLTIMGAGGRMGQALIKAVHENDRLELVGAIERDGTPHVGANSGILAGIGENNITITTDINKALDESDGVIDFTAPKASVELAQICASKKCVHVIGTTGCTPEDDAKIKDAAASTTIIKSGNMSLGVNLLAVLVERAAAALSAEDFDIEVLEMHHKHKVDAPSGTALLLGDAAAKGREIELEANAVKSREGITGAREEGTIGFATLRGGSVIGEHSVIYAGNGERIELTHQALDRSLFATGALKAALWGKEKAPGLYTMQDVLGL